MSFLEQLWYGRSPVASALSLPLAIPAALFGAGARIRAALYDRGTFTAHRVEGVKVISVGNLSVGGAGKTPAVIFLAQLLRARGVPVAVLSRGYGRLHRGALAVTPESSAEDAGDEPLLIHLRANVPVFVGADRVETAHWAKSEGARVLLLDDGMQHRRLARDVDILVLDGSVGFGNGRLLPAGPLREPPSAARRATLLWLRTNDPNASAPSGLEHLPLVRVAHRPDAWLGADGAAQGIEALKGQRLFAFAGLARPTPFFDSLRSLGATVCATRAYPDHHFFSDGELASLEAHARAERALLVTTEKDRMRLPKDAKVTVLTQKVELLSGQEHLDALAPSWDNTRA